MAIIQHIKTFIANPKILRPYKRIVLLSHMRANTSLFGHILGSNPEIEGYFELHIGYYSWKSLIRQKLIYFTDHKAKPSARYIFDKVLHNEHDVNLNVFRKKDVVIIMVREPLATIESIQKLYAKVNPTHELNNHEKAKAYYMERLNGLVDLASQCKHGYYFINANDLTQSPDTTLKYLTDFLQLKKPLSKKYQLFKNTGKSKAGDSSENMTKGEIQAKEIAPVDYSSRDIELGEYYNKAVSFLCKNAINKGNIE